MIIDLTGDETKIIYQMICQVSWPGEQLEIGASVKKKFEKEVSKLIQETNKKGKNED